MHSVRHRMTALDSPAQELPAATNLRFIPIPTALLINQMSALLLAVAFSLASGSRANAQGSPHLSITVPGGMPGWPIMNGITRLTNAVNISWDGPSGYYQLFQKQGVNDRTWQAIGTPYNLSRNATVANAFSSAFFRVSGPSPQYYGAQNCADCHGPVLNTVAHTLHSSAYSDALFGTQGGRTDKSCLPCHTVGSGLPTGFVNQSVTPGLAGVQCENCHGPAGNHAANPDDPTAVPRVELAATVCGGCHNAKFVPARAASEHPPRYEEWNASAHRAVLDELKAAFAGSSGPTVYIPNCGGCHSGTVREAFLENQSLPDAQEASAVGIACATCHDPHSQQTYANVLNGVYTFTSPLTGVGILIRNTELGAVYSTQLRNPLASTNNYSVVDGTFASHYNPNINLCAQCHNDRGASWTNWSRPPHHSLQYNMLLGTVGELASGTPPNLPGTHSQLEKQCVTCHMQTVGTNDPALLQAGDHTFHLRYTAITSNIVTTVTNTFYKADACTPCHDGQGQGLIEFMKNDVVSNLVYQVKIDLDSWATNAAPPALRSFGTRAWEYATPGGLSSGGTGPTNAALQSLIHTNIQKARFNLYLVYNDGSGGVHNPFYTLELLHTAAAWVQGVLTQPGQ